MTGLSKLSEAFSRAFGSQPEVPKAGKGYGDITVLLVSADWQETEAIHKQLASRRFRVHRAETMYEALPLLSKSDMLVLRMDLPNGNSANILDQWCRINPCGPACVLCPDMPTGNQINEMLETAWNVLPCSYKAWHIRHLMERLSIVVRGIRWATQISTMQRRQTFLWMVLAVLLAKDVGWSLVQTLLGMIH